MSKKTSQNKDSYQYYRLRFRMRLKQYNKVEKRLEAEAESLSTKKKKKNIEYNNQPVRPLNKVEWQNWRDKGLTNDDMIFHDFHNWDRIQEECILNKIKDYYSRLETPKTLSYREMTELKNKIAHGLLPKEYTDMINDEYHYLVNKYRSEGNPQAVKSAAAEISHSFWGSP